MSESLKPRCPRDLAVICMKAMEKSVNQRFQSMGELAEDLRRFLSNEPILAKPPTPIQRSTKWIRRHALFCSCAAIFVVGACASFYFLRESLIEKGNSKFATDFLPRADLIENLASGKNSNEKLEALYTLWSLSYFGTGYVFGLEHPQTLLLWNRMMEWAISEMDFSGDAPRKINDPKELWINLSSTYKYSLSLDGRAEAIPLFTNQAERQWAPDPAGPLVVIQQWENLAKDEPFVFAETQWGPNHAFPNELGKSLEITAKILWANGRYAEAEALFIRLLERNQRLWPNGKDGNPDAMCVWPSGSRKRVSHKDQRSVQKTKDYLQRLRAEWNLSKSLGK